MNLNIAWLMKWNQPCPKRQNLQMATYKKAFTKDENICSYHYENGKINVLIHIMKVADIGKCGQISVLNSASSQRKTAHLGTKSFQSF